MVKKISEIGVIKNKMVWTEENKTNDIFGIINFSRLRRVQYHSDDDLVPPYSDGSQTKGGDEESMKRRVGVNVYCVSWMAFLFVIVFVCVVVCTCGRGREVITVVDVIIML